MGDEIWIYYSGTNRDHDGLLDPAGKGHLSGIGRAILRLDGFVSADAGYGGGEIVTPIVRFKRRAFGAEPRHWGGGAVRVELQDAAGRPLSGYTEDDASYICGNSVRLPVRWGESWDVSSLSGATDPDPFCHARLQSYTRFSSSTRRVRSSRSRAFALRLCGLNRIAFGFLPIHDRSQWDIRLDSGRGARDSWR